MTQQNLGLFVQSVPSEHAAQIPVKYLFTYISSDTLMMTFKNLNFSMLSLEAFPCFTLSVKKRKKKKGRERAGNQLLVRDKFRAGEIHRSKRLLTRNWATGEKRWKRKRESAMEIRSEIKRAKTAREKTDTRFDGWKRPIIMTRCSRLLRIK